MLICYLHNYCYRKVYNDCTTTEICAESIYNLLPVGLISFYRFIDYLLRLFPFRIRTTVTVCLQKCISRFFVYLRNNSLHKQRFDYLIQALLSSTIFFLNISSILILLLRNVLFKQLHFVFVFFNYFFSCINVYISQSLLILFHLSTIICCIFYLSPSLSFPP